MKKMVGLGKKKLCMNIYRLDVIFTKKFKHYARECLENKENFEMPKP